MNDLISSREIIITKVVVNESEDNVERVYEKAPSYGEAVGNEAKAALGTHYATADYRETLLKELSKSTRNLQYTTTTVRSLVFTLSNECEVSGRLDSQSRYYIESGQPTTRLPNDNQSRP